MFSLYDQSARALVDHHGMGRGRVGQQNRYVVNAMLRTLQNAAENRNFVAMRAANDDLDYFFASGGTKLSLVDSEASARQKRANQILREIGVNLQKKEIDTEYETMNMFGFQTTGKLARANSRLAAALFSRLIWCEQNEKSLESIHEARQAFFDFYKQMKTDDVALRERMRIERAQRETQRAADKAAWLLAREINYLADAVGSPYVKADHDATPEANIRFMNQLRDLLALASECSGW